MEALIDVTDVNVLPDHRLMLKFENGEKRIFDMNPFLKKEPFIVLNNNRIFKKAHVEAGTVVWPGEIDIAPETLYRRSIPV